MVNAVRWGIIGTGNIARKFAKGLAVLSDAILLAVASRNPRTAEEFARAFNVPRRYSPYEAMLQDPDVDVVYVATPHSFHKENTIMCLEAGKPVLCEKPFTINAQEAEEVIAVARQRGLFLMEAMWTRFLPMMVKIREMLEQGSIGEVQMLIADFGERVQFDPKSRLFDPHLGGGALLDLGVYPISLASMIFGPPARVTSLAQLGETQVDEQEGMVFHYDGGQMAVLYASVRVRTPQEAIIVGTNGRIRVHAPWWAPNQFTISTPKTDTDMIVPFAGNGYNYEAKEVMACLRAGKTESPIMSLDETLSIMRTMDELRAQWGMRYPQEGRE
jgi:predicted dehydrogenase